MFFLWRLSVCKTPDVSRTLLSILVLLFYSFESFSTSALADGFSLESDWQYVSSSLQNSSQYSGIIILLIWEFFTPALADGFPLETEWQHVSSSLQDAS